MSNAVTKNRFECFSPEEREALRRSVRRFYDDLLREDMYDPHNEERIALMGMLSYLNFEITSLELRKTMCL